MATASRLAEADVIATWLLALAPWGWVVACCVRIVQLERHRRAPMPGPWRPPLPPVRYTNEPLTMAQLRAAQPPPNA